MKTTVYLNKHAEELYKRIKDFNPEFSLSVATEEGLKHLAEEMETQLTGMIEQIARRGYKISGEYCGMLAKFIGKELAHVQTDQVGLKAYKYQTLYFTRKGKYLLQETIEDEEIGEFKYEYYICHSIDELREQASPRLLTKAGKTAGELLFDLDI